MSNTINLMDQYADKLELLMKREAHVWGKAKGKYNFDGVKTVKAITPVTQEMNDYNPAAASGTPRFGTLAEVEDTLHTYTLQYSKSNNMSIDKEYNTEQKMLKRAGEIMAYQINQVYVPFKDKAALTQYVAGAGVKSTDGTLTNETVVTKLANARKSFVNNHVAGNAKDLVCWIRSTDYTKLILAKEFTYLDKVAPKALVEGAMGKCAGFSIFEIADEDMPDNVNFVCANLNCIMNVDKFETLRILKTHPDVDGAVLQPHMVFGAFVNETLKNGVYVSNIEAASI